MFNAASLTTAKTVVMETRDQEIFLKSGMYTIKYYSIMERRNSCHL